jgi:acyl carrier protein
MNKFCDNFQIAVDFEVPVSIDGNTILKDLAEWDSLAALGIIVMFDLEYGKLVDAEMLAGCTTVGDLYKLTL